jgi:signal transduction histidine kinase
VWVNDDARIAYNESNAALYIQGYMADITERKATEKKLDDARVEREQMLEVARAQNEQLRELDVMKDEFVALVSHELRTPLTAIQGYTELVLDGTLGELNDEQRAMLAVVDRNSIRLFRLINDLLFVAQVNAGELNVAIEDVDLVPLPPRPSPMRSRAPRPPTSRSRSSATRRLPSGPTACASPRSSTT